MRSKARTGAGGGGAGSTRRMTKGMRAMDGEWFIEVYNFRGDAEWAQANIVKHMGWDVPLHRLKTTLIHHILQCC